MASTKPLQRSLYGLFGLVEAVLGLLLSVYALKGIKEFWNPAAPVWITGVFEFANIALAVALLLAGGRSLRVAWTGVPQRGGMIGGVLVGAGLLIPATLLSLPLTIALANHRWPGDGQSGLAAMVWSLCIGVATTVIYWTVLLLRAIIRHRNSQAQPTSPLQ